MSPKSLILFCKCVMSLDCSSNQMDFLHTCKNIILQHSYQFILSIYVVVVVFDEQRVNSTSIIDMVFKFIPHIVNQYLYTYIQIWDKKCTHMLYVYFYEIVSESCNYTFIDRMCISFEFLEFQNFNIFTIYLSAKFQTSPLVQNLALAQKVQILEKFP